MPVTGFTVYPTRDMDKDTFNAGSDTWMGQLAQFVSDCNTTEANCVTQATNAATSATASATSATSASTSATAAATSATSASTSATAAATSATTAVNAPGTQGTSSTSATIPTSAFPNTISLTMQTGKSIQAGMWFQATDQANPANGFAGPVSSYVSGTGVIQIAVPGVYATSGAGTKASWYVNQCAPMSATFAWSQIASGKPTTRDGYGITDVPKFTQATYNLTVMSTTVPTLPDLTLGYASVDITAPTNATAVPATVNTSDSWVLTPGFVAGTLKTIAPSYLGTSHGVWPGVNVLPPAAQTLTAAGTPVVLGVAQIDTDLVVVLFRVSTTAYVVAFKPSTNTFGAIQALTGTAASAQDGVPTVSKVTTTSFVAAISTTVGSVQAGSINTGTLAITLGSAVTTTGLPNQCAMQLSSSLYLMNVNNANDMVAFSVSGTVVTLGTAVASGCANVGDMRSLRFWRSDNTTALLVFYGTGGGTSSTRSLQARTVSIAGTTLTMNTIVTEGGGNVYTQTNLSFLLSLTDGATYLASESGVQKVYAITVSGTAPTWATSVTNGGFAITTLTGAVTDPKSTYIVQPAKTMVRASSTQAYMILGTGGAAGYTGVQYTGGTLTVGTKVTKGVTTNILADPTGATFAAVGTDTDILSISGATASSVATFTGAAATMLPGPTISDKAVKYASTWYAWQFGVTFDTALSATQWLAHSGSTFTVYGSVA